MSETNPVGTTCTCAVQKCHDCGTIYGSDFWIEAVIPDEIWDNISPAAARGAGLLCISCMAARLRRKGYAWGSVSLKMTGTEPFKYDVQDTHRIVPVELLERCSREFQSLEGTELAYPEHAAAVQCYHELRAIIDKEST